MKISPQSLEQIQLINSYKILLILNNGQIMACTLTSATLIKFTIIRKESTDLVYILNLVGVFYYHGLMVVCRTPPHRTDSK